MIQDIKIHNKFDIEILEKDKPVERLTAYNMVLDRAYKSIIGRERWWSYLHVGSSSTAPDATQTSLGKYEGYAVISGGEPTFSVENNHTAVARCKFHFNTSALAGKTFAEVGLSTITTNGGLFNRARFTDINGNPITIVKTDTMEITIYVSIYITIPISSSTYVHDPRTLFGYMGSTSTILQYFTFGGGGVSLSSSSGIVADATSFSKKLDRLQANQLNGLGGINMIATNGIMEYLPKKDLSHLALVDVPLGTGNGSKVSFGCGCPLKTAQVKIDGVIVSQSQYAFNRLGNYNGVDNDRTAVDSYIFWSGDNTPLHTQNGPNNNTFRYLFSREDEWNVFDIFNGDNIIQEAIITKPEVNGIQVHDSNPIAEYSTDGVTWQSFPIPNPGFFTGIPGGNKACKIRVKYVNNDPNIKRVITFRFWPYTWSPQIKFVTPPPAGSTITISGVPYGVPKNDQYVIDAVTTVDWTP